MKKVNDNAKISSAAKAKASDKMANFGSDAEVTSDNGVDSVTSLHDNTETPMETPMNVSPAKPDAADNATDSATAAVKPKGRRTRSSAKTNSTSAESTAVSTNDAAENDAARNGTVTNGAVRNGSAKNSTITKRKIIGSLNRPAEVRAAADSDVDIYSGNAPKSSFNSNRAPLEGSSGEARYAPNRLPNYQGFQPGHQSNDRIAIFIDGSNLFYAASHLNIEVDYRRLLTTLVRGRRLLRAYFYTGVDPQNEKQRGFLLWLNRHGHRVVSKELAHLPDGSRKANMHVEMAVDMMRIAEYCSTLTLLGGDGNLAYALQVLSQRGTSLEVVSLQSMTSDSLIDLADNYTDLAALRDQIKR
ncbi:MAG: NYN domain-containing protein [Cyanobacteria bacterium P01_F01_bin.53]